MPDLGDITRWIRDNEALLSGIAALIAVAGVILSALTLGTRRVLTRLRPPDAPAAPPEPMPAPNGDHILAVLAFDNLSSDTEMQFFSDGVSEELIRRLSSGTNLKVIARTSSFQFRGEQKGEAARSLRCSHVLDGSIRRAAGRVRMNVHLVEASSRTTVWSDRFDCSLEDIFAVQDQISENIARALDRAFSGTPVRPVDPALYDLFLRSSPKSYAPDELRGHVSVLEVVTQRAPDFAEAWGRLAYLRSWLHFYLPFAERPANAGMVAREAARALDYDPESIDGMAAQLFVAPPFGSFVEYGAILERIRRSPSSGDGRRYVSWHLRTLGRIRESLEEAERAYRLDALDPMTANLVALARMAAGRVAEAVPVYEELVERIPEMSFPVSSLLRAHAFEEDWAAGRSRAGDRGEAPAARVPGGFGLHPREARSDRGEHRRLAGRSRSARAQDRQRRRVAPGLFRTPRPGRRCVPHRGDRSPGPGRNQGRHHGPGRLPHLAAVPGRNAGDPQRPALPAPLCAARARRILDGDGHVAQLRRRSPLRLRAECTKARALPKEEFPFTSSMPESI